MQYLLMTRFRRSSSFSSTALDASIVAITKVVRERGSRLNIFLLFCDQRYSIALDCLSENLVDRDGHPAVMDLQDSSVITAMAVTHWRYSVSSL